MTHAPFDPSQAVTFDFANGHVHLDGAPHRVLVPAEALATLCEAAGPDASAALGRTMGETMGHRVAHRLTQGHGGEQTGGDATSASQSAGVISATMETVVDHLAGELSLAGLGVLGIERWGRALVMVLDHDPLPREMDGFVEGVIEGAIFGSTARRVRCVTLSREGSRVRLLVGGSIAADRVRSWLAEGVSWGDAVVRLHTAAGATEALPARASMAPPSRGEA